MFPDDQELVPAVTSPGGTAETTGRWVVTFADEDEADLEATLRGAGVSHVASSRDFAEQAVDVGQAQGGDAVVLAELGVAVVSAEPAQVTAMRAAAPGAILSVGMAWSIRPGIAVANSVRALASDIGSSVNSGRPAS